MKCVLSPYELSKEFIFVYISSQRKVYSLPFREPDDVRHISGLKLLKRMKEIVLIIFYYVRFKDTERSRNLHQSTFCLGLGTSNRRQYLCRDHI